MILFLRLVLLVLFSTGAAATGDEGIEGAISATPLCDVFGASVGGVVIDAASDGRPADGAADFGGLWTSTYGQLVLEQDGNRVSGSYDDGGAIDGQVEGNLLTFHYREPSARGEGWFELAPDGRSFAGKWREEGRRVWLDWTGTRSEDLFSSDFFEGLWSTSYGMMRLWREDDQIKGSYSYSRGSKVAGTMKERRLEFRYNEPSAEGEGWFELSEDGQSFEGKWREKGGRAWKDWTGTRIVPVPGRIWLVILEARWENSLAEPEYTFGDMLSMYFTMALARHVKVRHRFFHDHEDFQRWCNEAAFLAEPVVLLVSTHGTQEGITVGGETIGAEIIAESLQFAGNLELLHLSGCLMMDGSLPREIMRRLPPQRCFPISGYSTSVAWDASALSDFTFLSLLLIRGLAPGEAVAQANLLAPYTAAEAVEGGVFRPLGLEVLLPADLDRKDTTEETSR